MLTEDAKKRIETLTTDEMEYEIQLGKSSRFQREKFAYLQACYQKRKEEEKELKSRAWYTRPLGIIALGVIVTVLSAATIWGLRHYFNVEL